MRLIDADKLFKKFYNLEAQAVAYVGKLIARDAEEPSEEWRIWSAILCERTAFKHDIFDAPTIDAIPVVRCKDCRWGREVCGNIKCSIDYNLPPEYHGYDWFCPNGERREDEMS